MFTFVQAAGVDFSSFLRQSRHCLFKAKLPALIRSILRLLRTAAGPFRLHPFAAGLSSFLAAMLVPASAEQVGSHLPKDDFPDELSIILIKSIEILAESYRLITHGSGSSMRRFTSSCPSLKIIWPSS